MVQSSKVRYKTETMDLSGDAQSEAIDCRYVEAGSYQLVWQGLAGLASTIIPQISNDGTNWSDWENEFDDIIYTLSTASGSQIWSIEETPPRYIRLSYVANGNTAGTATLTWEGRRYV